MSLEYSLGPSGFKGEPSGLTPEELDAAMLALFDASPAGAWLDISDLSTMSQDVLGVTPAAVDSPVGRIEDKSGNDHHAIAHSSQVARRPILRQSGNLYYLEFDNVDDAVQALFTMDQPWDRVTAFRQVTWTNDDSLYDGGSFITGLLRQRLSSPNLAIYAGASGPTSTVDAIGENAIEHSHYEGASSSISVNEETPVTGNAGTSTSAGLTVGARANLGNPADMWFFGGVWREGTFTSQELANTQAWAKLKAGI